MSFKVGDTIICINETEGWKDKRCEVILISPHSPWPYLVRCLEGERENDTGYLDAKEMIKEQ